MSRGFRQLLGRVPCLLAIFSLLAFAAPGCGDSAKKGDGASQLPPSVQESNKNMEDFMKTSKTKKN